MAQSNIPLTDKQLRKIFVDTVNSFTNDEKTETKDTIEMTKEDYLKALRAEYLQGKEFGESIGYTKGLFDGYKKSIKIMADLPDGKSFGQAVDRV